MIPVILRILSGIFSTKKCMAMWDFRRKHKAAARKHAQTKNRRLSSTEFRSELLTRYRAITDTRMIIKKMPVHSQVDQKRNDSVPRLNLLSADILKDLQGAATNIVNVAFKC